MKLYNTLTRRVEPFKPLDNDVVKIYSCGPTVYDYAHIGNLRAFIFADTLRRALVGCDYKVMQVMNITDVGHLTDDADAGTDKLEKGAAREGKTVWDVAKAYTDAFLNDAKSLNIQQPNGYPESPDGYARATNFIDQQISMVQTLLDQGYAYKTEQAIYFDVTKLEDYGKLSGQKLADKEVAVRNEVVEDKDKKHPFDFAVWLFTVGRFKDHSMHWSTPWGNGFPGWHLECSAIIHATLGDPIDIHTGGIDHIGTHHTNEMAQTEAAYHNQLANYWLHNGFVMVDGKKMSKSLGNFYTLKDITQKSYDPLVFRLFVLQSHYRSELNFTWTNLDAAKTRLKDLQAWADLQFQANDAGTLGNDYFKNLTNDIKEAISNDLNTPEVLKILSEAVSHTYTYAKGISHVNLHDFKEFLKFVDSVLGLNLAQRQDITSEQKDLLAQRQQAKANKNFEQADKLRDQLKDQQIGIKDDFTEQTWFRL